MTGGGEERGAMGKRRRLKIEKTKREEAKTSNGKQTKCQNKICGY